MGDRVLDPLAYLNQIDRSVLTEAQATEKAFLAYTNAEGRLATFLLEAGEVAIGRDPDCHLCFDWDASVSELNVVVSHLARRWRARDVAGRNPVGFRRPADPVNGTLEQFGTLDPALHHYLESGDLLRIGRVPVCFIGQQRRVSGTELVAPPKPPVRVTRAERELLEVLCREYQAGSLPSTEDLANELFKTSKSAQKVLGDLYKKFDIKVEDRQKRAELARMALRDGTVS